MRKKLVIFFLCLVVLPLPIFSEWITQNSTVSTAGNHTLTAKWLNGYISAPDGDELPVGEDNTFTFHNTGNIEDSRITFTWFVDDVQKQSGSSTSYAVNVDVEGNHTIRCDATINGKTFSKSGVYEFVSAEKQVGGKIFYIDSTTDGTYTFKNAQGQTVSAPSVGTNCIGWTYTVKGATKDKYYVADVSTKGTYLNRQYDGTNYIVWATGGESLPSSDIDVLSSVNSEVGTGRRNTDYIRNSKYDSTYYPKTVGNSSNRISVWDCALQANNANANGCNDWYVPSIRELINLKSASDLSAWHNAVKYSSNENSKVWSSSANSDSNKAYYFGVTSRKKATGGTQTTSTTTNTSRSSATNEFVCVLIRSF